MRLLAELRGNGVARRSKPHTVICRVTDTTGHVQTRERVNPVPDGVTGWHLLLRRLQHRLHLVIEPAVTERVALLAVNQRDRFERRGFRGQAAREPVCTQDG